MAGEFPESGIQATVRDLDKFLADIGRMDKAIQGVGSDMSSIRNWNDSITTVTANVGKIITGAAVGATAAWGGFIADSVKKSTILEQSVADIGAVWGKMGDELVPIRDLIQNLGLDPNLKVSSTEAGQAIEALARNGVTMEEAINGAAEATVLLSNATGGDFTNSANIASDAMAQFGIESKDLDKVINGIVGTTTNSKLTIDGYGLAIGQAGGTAASFGVSLEDMNTTLAGTITRFNGGSDAGTGFKTFLQRLVPASGPATDAMRDLGLFTGLTKDEFESAQDKIVKYKDQLADLDPTSKKYAERSEELRGKITALESSLVTGKNAFFDNNGAMKDMDEIAGILRDATAGLSEEQKNAALSTIFGTDAIRTALGLADLGQDAYNELAKSIHSVDAAQMAAARNDTFQGSLEILGGIIETLQQSIGKRFEPALRSITDWASRFLSENADRIVNFFGVFADGLKTGADRLIPLVESWLPKLEEKMNDGSFSVEGMIDKVGGIIKGIKDFTDKIIGVVKPVAEWITKNYELDDILNGVLAVITVSLIPAITSLVTTIGPVIALFGSIAELSSRMSEGQKQFALAVGVAVFALPPLISAIGTVTGAISAVIGVGSSLVGILTGGGGVVAALGALLNPVGLVVAAVAGLGLAWATDFGGIRTKTTEIVGDVSKKIGEIVGDVSKKIGEWSTNTSEKFKETQGNIGKTLASWSENIGTTLSSWSQNTGSTLATWSGNIGGLFTRLKDSVVGDNKRLTDDSLKEFGRLAAQGGTSAQQLKDSLSRLSGESSTVASGNYRALTNDSVASLARLFSEGSGSAQRLLDVLKNQSSDASGTVKSNFYNLASDAISSFSRFQNEGGAIFTRFRENATNKVGEMVRDIPARLRELVDAGLRIFDVGKWVQAGADIIGGVMTGLARAATAPLRWIENFASGLIGLFTSKLKIASPSQVFDEFGVNIMEGLEGGLESRGDGVLDYMATFSDALVATAAEAQRQADKNFAALTESATAAYNGYVVIAGDMAKLSQAIDQNAIAAAEAARKAAEAAKQAEKDKAAAEVAAVDKYFGFGRVSELIDQIKGIVNAAFEVNGTAVRSLGIDLSGLTTSSATSDAIARLQLLAGTIQQNAGAATNVDDRNRLSSLYNDVAGRILPLLRNQMQQQLAVEDKAKADAAAAAEEAAAKAAAEAAAAAAAKAQSEAQQRAAQQATSSFLQQAIAPLLDNIRQLGQFGANVFFSSSEVAAFDSSGRAAFAQADQRLEETISYMLNRAQNDLTSLSSFSAANNAMSFLADTLAEIEENLGRYSSLSFLGLNQAEVSSKFGDIYGAYNLLSAALPVLSGASTTVNTTINTGSINNGMDAAALQAYIEYAVANALP